MSAETLPAENVEALIEVLLDVDERLAREDAATEAPAANTA